MKHVSTLLLALGLATVSAVGQNVTVVLKDGTSHKFNVDNVKELSFREVTETPPVEFKNIDVNAWGSGCTLTFTDATGNVKFTTDIYNPSSEPWMHAGTFNCDSSTTAYTFDPDYSTVTLGEDTQNVTAGTIVVTLEGEVYSFDINLTLANGEAFAGKWSGELPSYTPWLKADLTGAAYNSNPQQPGTFYVKLNDADYDYEMAMVFNAESTATELPAGTYTYSDVAAINTLSPASYVSVSRPYAELRLVSGSQIQVAKEGDTYVMTMEFNFTDGRTGKFNFRGKISGEPTFVDPDPEPEPEPDRVVYDKLRFDYYGGGNNTLTFTMSAGGPTLMLDFYGNASSKWFETGVYTIGGSTVPYISNSPSYTYIMENDVKHEISGGTVTVTREDAVYTFKMDLKMSDGTDYYAIYTGSLNTNFAEVLDITLSKASYNENARPAGNFYVKLNNDSYSCDMALDLYADASETVLPSGEYTYSTEKTPGTFSEASYVDLTGPSSSNRMAEGSKVTVVKDGENYTFTMDLNFVDGRVAHVTYSGKITGEPNFGE